MEKWERKDDYSKRGAHLSALSEQELEERFWELCFRLTDPLVKLAETHTSPSIERSVLLRMGFSSLEAKAIVDRCTEYHLLGKGAGHVVLKTARAEKMDVTEAGRKLAAGELWDTAQGLFSGSAQNEQVNNNGHTKRNPPIEREGADRKGGIV